MIEIENAIELLSKEYPQFHVHAKMKLKLLTLKKCITVERPNWDVSHLNSKSVFPADGFISLEFFNDIQKKFDEIIRLRDEARRTCIHNEADCIRIKNIKELNGDKLDQRRLINAIENILVYLPATIKEKKVELNVTDYCWYFGDWVDSNFYETQKSLNKMSELVYFECKSDSDIAYELEKLRIELSSESYGYSANSLYLFNANLHRLSKGFYSINVDSINVKRVYINDPKQIHIDQVYGGIFRQHPPQTQFYSDVSPEVVINFDDIYVLKSDYDAFIGKPKKEKLKPVLDRRNEVLRKVIKEDMIPSLLECDGITSKFTKQALINTISTLDQLTHDEKTLFSGSGMDDFLKSSKNPKLSSIIRFTSGNPGKKSIG